MKIRFLPSPEVFSEKEAQKIAKKLVALPESEKRFYFGEIEINSEDIENVARKYMDRIYSLPKEDLEDLQFLKENASQVRMFPWLFGTYEPSSSRRSSQMVFADFTLFDVGYFYLAPVIYYPAYLLLRGLYYLGRKNWWRHELLHAKHHFAAEKYIERKRKTSVNHFVNAMYFIHESGLEEFVTRWQSYKEAQGKMEKIVSAVALMLYMEYSLFTGPRNFTTSLKEYLDRKIKNNWIRRCAKLGVVSSLAGIPFMYLAEALKYLKENKQELVEALHNYGIVYENQILESIENGLIRLYALYLVSLGGAFFSTKRKGLKKWETTKSVNEYKFPYTYNPLKAFYRSVKAVRYLSKVWGVLPNYWNLEEEKEKYDEIMKRVENSKLSEKEKDFTKSLIKEIYEDAQKKGEYEIYLKHEFIPYFYANAKNLFY